jgi:hypothetical protein
VEVEGFLGVVVDVVVAVLFDVVGNSDFLEADRVVGLC